RYARHSRISCPPRWGARQTNASARYRARSRLTTHLLTTHLLAVPSKKLHVSTTVNGEAAEFLCEPRQSLLEVLRDNLRLTGAKEGCNNGNCGACTVLMNGLPENSCIVLAAEAEGAQIDAVKSLAQ